MHRAAAHGHIIRGTQIALAIYAKIAFLKFFSQISLNNGNRRTTNDERRTTNDYNIDGRRCGGGTVTLHMRLGHLAGWGTAEGGSTIQENHTYVAQLHCVSHTNGLNLLGTKGRHLSSIDFLHKGAASDFISELEREVLSHPAVHHPYLKMLGSGEFNDMDSAIRDYAHQYSFYSQLFPEYVKAVIDTTSDPIIIEPLQENLDEELGTGAHGDSKAGTPHTVLFAEFKRSIGIDQAYVENNQMSLTAQIWRQLFLEKCKSSVTAVGVGAISLATEYIVPHFYPYIVDAIEKHSTFDNSTSFFFRLHVDCDEGHAEEAIKVAEYLSQDTDNREALRFGVFSALNLRHAFYDSQLGRALNMESDNL